MTSKTKKDYNTELLKTDYNIIHLPNSKTCKPVSYTESYLKSWVKPRLTTVTQATRQWIEQIWFIFIKSGNGWSAPIPFHLVTLLCFSHRSPPLQWFYWESSVFQWVAPSHQGDSRLDWFKQHQPKPERKNIQH